LGSQQRQSRSETPIKQPNGGPEAKELPITQQVNKHGWLGASLWPRQCGL